MAEQKALFGFTSDDTEVFADYSTGGLIHERLF